jgi:hypothetical protein
VLRHNASPSTRCVPGALSTKHAAQDAPVEAGEITLPESISRYQRLNLNHLLHLCFSSLPLITGTSSPGSEVFLGNFWSRSIDPFKQGPLVLFLNYLPESLVHRSVVLRNVCRASSYNLDRLKINHSSMTDIWTDTRGCITQMVAASVQGEGTRTKFFSVHHFAVPFITSRLKFVGSQ